MRQFLASTGKAVLEQLTPRAVLYGVTAGVLWLQLHRHDAAQRAIGARDAIIASYVAANRVNAQQLRRVDTVWRRDSIVRIRTREHYTTLRDTVLAHTTDTAIVERFVKAADADAKVCTDGLSSCNEFRRLAYQRFDNYEAQLKAARAVTPRRCGLGFTAGAGAVWQRSSLYAGPGALAGVSCRW